MNEKERTRVDAQPKIKVDPVLRWPMNLHFRPGVREERERVLRGSLEEYERRLNLVRSKVGDDGFELLFKEPDCYFKFLVTATILRRGRVNLAELEREILTDFGTSFSDKFGSVVGERLPEPIRTYLTNSYAVISDRVKTGGKNLRKD